MRAVAHRRTKFIDGEFLYKYYFETMGTARSTYKLPQIAYDNGMRNIQGKAPSFMGVWKAMWSWACKPENREEAYRMYNAHLADYGQYATMEQFKDVLRDKLKNVLQPKNDAAYRRYLKARDL